MEHLGKIYDKNDYENRVDLGSGAFGIVYSIYDKKLGKTVVIKQINKIMNPENKILAEVDILNQLKYSCDKNILCYLDFKEDMNNFYIITEYLGQFITLTDFIQGKAPIDINKWIALIENLKIGLMTCHKKGVAHRDIKPDNIMVNPTTMDVKYIDFGLSCRMDTCTDVKIPGTPLYSGPELYTTDRRLRKPNNLFAWFVADYWSLGATIIEMFLKKPFIDHIGMLSIKHEPEDIHDIVQISDYLVRGSFSPALLSDIFDAYFKNPQITQYFVNSIYPLIQSSPFKRKMFIESNKSYDSPNFEKVDLTLDL